MTALPLRGVVRARQAYPLVLAQTIDGAGAPRPILFAAMAAAGSGSTGFVLWPLDADNAVRRFDERLGRDGVDAMAGLVALGERAVKGLSPHAGVRLAPRCGRAAGGGSPPGGRLDRAVIHGTGWAAP